MTLTGPTIRFRHLIYTSDNKIRKHILWFCFSHFLALEVEPEVATDVSEHYFVVFGWQIIEDKSIKTKIQNNFVLIPNTK